MGRGRLSGKENVKTGMRQNRTRNKNRIRKSAGLRNVCSLIGLLLSVCLLVSGAQALEAQDDPIALLQSLEQLNSMGGEQQQDAASAGSTVYTAAENSNDESIRADVSQTFTSSQGMTWYVKGIAGELSAAVAYAGRDPVEVSQFGGLGETGGPTPKTLLLVDNSTSIAEASVDAVDRIKGILTRLVWNHQSRERFALKTFSDHVETLVDYTENYDAIRVAVEHLTFAEQDTFLRNVLYEEIMTLAEDGEDAYDRIIVISDGTDDSRLGVTYEELTALLGDEKHRMPIYTIGFRHEPTVTDLDRLFALSRKTRTPYYWAEDFRDPTTIADGICEDTDQISYFRLNFPPELRTGDTRTITVSAQSGQGLYTIVHTMALPVASVGELAQLQAQQKEREEQQAAQNARLEELESEVEAARQAKENETEKPTAVTELVTEEETEAPETEKITEAQTEEPETEMSPEELLRLRRQEQMKSLARYGVWIALGLILLLLILNTAFGKKKEKTRQDFREMAPVKEDDTPKVDVSAQVGSQVVLVNLSQPDLQYTIGIGEMKILGRSRARCDIAFQDDRSMAARQCRIYFEFGKVFVENLDTMGSTYLNGEVVRSAQELTSGSVLKLGDTKLRVLYD